jgi:hypothetical protein
LLLALLAGCGRSDVVTERNLLESESYWPYQVELTRRFEAPGRALDAGTTGVLIRVEDRGLARIDFGRDGLYEVPVASTDLVARANGVRSGELEKVAPHFVFAIGTRLIDPAPEPPRALRLDDFSGDRAFLSVFADPRSRQLDEIAHALAPLRASPDLRVILFPQGRVPDAEVGTRLRELAWPVPFVYDHLSDAYTRSLLAPPLAPPAVVLQTAEGRVLFAAPWSADVVPSIDSALSASSLHRP